jgi:hypothetical protein
MRLTCRCTSVTPALGKNSAAESVVGIAIMRRPCVSAPQALASLAALPRTPASAESPSASRTSRQRASSITLVASITEPPPTATMRSARAARSASAPASTPSRGLCAPMASNFPANFLPRLSTIRLTSAPSVIERVVVTKIRSEAARTISSSSACATGFP